MLKFDSMLLINESSVDNKNSILKKTIFKIKCLWTQLNFIKGLIEFMEGLIARKIYLDFYWKKLKF